MSGWERAFGLWQGRYLTQPLAATLPPTTNNTITSSSATRLVVSPPSINGAVITRRAVECLLTVLMAMPHRITATTSPTATTPPTTPTDEDVVVGDVTTAGISMTLLRQLISTSSSIAKVGSPPVSSEPPTPTTNADDEGKEGITVEAATGVNTTQSADEASGLEGVAKTGDGAVNEQHALPRKGSSVGSIPLSVEACAVGAQLCMNNGRMWKLALEWASAGVSIVEAHLSSTTTPAATTTVTSPSPVLHHSPPLLSSFPAATSHQRKDAAPSSSSLSTPPRSPISVSARKLYKVAITAARKGKQDDMVGRLIVAMGDEAPSPHPPQQRANAAHLPFSGSAQQPQSQPQSSRPARQSPSRYYNNKNGGNNHHRFSDRGWNHNQNHSSRGNGGGGDGGHRNDYTPNH